MGVPDIVVEWSKPFRDNQNFCSGNVRFFAAPTHLHNAPCMRILNRLPHYDLFARCPAGNADFAGADFVRQADHVKSAKCVGASLAISGEKLIFVFWREHLSDSESELVADLDRFASRDLRSPCFQD